MKSNIHSLISRLNKLSNWQVALIIVVVSFVVYASGFSNPFQGDDYGQIVDNVPVHSISNIVLFFKGGTFYNGEGLEPLSGVYYRPLMTTVFSLVYSLFGAHAIYFHILQLLLFTASAFFVYLVFAYSFSRWIALFLSLLLLVHPIDSEIVYAIPVMQDTLYFFFGMLGLYLI